VCYHRFALRREGEAMQVLHTMVLRKSGGAWVALCLENGVVGQGATKEEAGRKLQDAIAAFEAARGEEADVYAAPLSIRELHEFLTYDTEQPTAESYELCAVYA
jgi:predicted RNase H-like HicB family nuclease